MVLGAGPVAPVQAATVNIGTIGAEMANHLGTDHDAEPENCIRYAPPPELDLIDHR